MVAGRGRRLRAQRGGQVVAVVALLLFQLEGEFVLQGLKRKCRGSLRLALKIRFYCTMSS